MRTTTGRKFAALFHETLRSQAASAKEGSRHVLTVAAKAAMDKLGLLSAPTQLASASAASLLEGQLHAARRHLEVSAALRTGGKPLESVRREPGAVVVDFAPGEGFSVW